MLQIQNTQTMSSREIAELTNKEHRNVTADIEKLMNELGGVLKIQHTTYVNDQNKQEYKMYLLDKESTLVLISGYSAEIRLKIIRRWQELETKSNLTVFNQDTSTHRGALLALVASLDKIEADKPKVAYFDNLVERNLLINIRGTATELKIKQNTFVKWLLDNKYVYRDVKEQLKPYAVHTPLLFELKEYINPNNGQPGNQLLTTPRGRETFNLLLNGGK